jgi:DNA repair protein RecO (recombination protein O)
VRGIVLRGRPLGEADRIVTMLTLECGKLDGVAKGVRRAKSHFAGRLEFGNESLLGMHRGRSLDVIVTADLVRAPWTRLVEPERFAVASLVAELVDAFCEPEMPVPEIYELLAGVLEAIAASDDPQSLLPRFSLRLLDALGLAPPFDRCVRCDASLEGIGAWLDGEAGGAVDERCREGWRDLEELDIADLENLRALARPRGAQAALRARPRAARATRTLLAHHLGRQPKAGAHLSEFVRR